MAGCRVGGNGRARFLCSFCGLCVYSSVPMSYGSTEHNKSRPRMAIILFVVKDSKLTNDVTMNCCTIWATNARKERIMKVFCIVHLNLRVFETMRRTTCAYRITDETWTTKTAKKASSRHVSLHLRHITLRLRHCKKYEVLIRSYYGFQTPWDPVFLR